MPAPAATPCPATEAVSAELVISLLFCASTVTLAFWLPAIVLLPSSSVTGTSIWVLLIPAVVFLLISVVADAPCTATLPEPPTPTATLITRAVSFAVTFTAAFSSFALVSIVLIVLLLISAVTCCSAFSLSSETPPISV